MSMKKITSLVLAGALSVGMAATAFAAVADTDPIVGLLKQSDANVNAVTVDNMGDNFGAGTNFPTLTANTFNAMGRNTLTISPSKVVDPTANSTFGFEIDIATLLDADDQLARETVNVVGPEYDMDFPNNWTSDSLASLDVKATIPNNIGVASYSNGTFSFVGLNEYVYAADTTVNFPITITAKTATPTTAQMAAALGGAWSQDFDNTFTKTLTLNVTFRLKGDTTTTTATTVSANAPTISSVSVTGTSVTTSNKTYTINFNKAMNTTAGVGTATISGNAALANGVWNAAKTAITYDLSGLSTGTTYTVTISGFQDAAGDVMASTTRSFTTTGTASRLYNLSSNAKVKSFKDGYSLLFGVASTYSAGETGRYGIVDLGTIRPQDEVEIWIDLYTDMFNWDTTDIPLGYSLTSQIIRNSKITARTQVAKGSKAIDTTHIDYDGGAAYVCVELVDEWVSVEELDFEFTTYVLIDSKRYDTAGEGVTFYGTLENYEILVYSGDDYVDTSRGEVATAMDFISSIEVDLGSGVSVFTKFYKDKSYYGTATRDPDDAADVVFAKYPDVDNVVRLKTVGLNSTGDIVKLSTDYSDYYVYDADLNYLGQSSERLPFSSRYYLANRKLDVASDDIGGDEPTDFEGPGDSGGDTGASNANFNPGTGR